MSTKYLKMRISKKEVRVYTYPLIFPAEIAKLITPDPTKEE